MEGIITPQYVWITAGAGMWTNEAAAEALAKRAAGVDKFKITRVATLLDSPFILIGKEEFYDRLGGARYAHMVGDIHHALPKKEVRGDISALSAGGWGGVSWCISYDTDWIHKRNSIPVSRRELILEFEHVGLNEPPLPLTLQVSIPEEREKPYGCIVLAAMVIGSLGYDEH